MYWIYCIACKFIEKENINLDFSPIKFRVFFVINYFISETTSYNIYRHNTFYYTQVLSSHTVK